MRGAHGALVGTRLWASSREALVHPRHHAAILAAGGDDTLRTRVVNIARQLASPSGVSARVLQNAFTRRWHGREGELERIAASEGPRYRQGALEGDAEAAGGWVGEAAGLVGSIEQARAIVERMVAQAADLLDRRAGANLV